jgi:hypothetical protein
MSLGRTGVALCPEVADRGIQVQLSSTNPTQLRTRPSWFPGRVRSSAELAILIVADLAREGVAAVLQVADALDVAPVDRFRGSSPSGCRPPD